MAGNKDNLLRDLTPEQAREYGSRGGKVTSLAKKLSQRHYCVPECPIWDRCWAKHISMSVKDDEMDKAIRKIADLNLKPKEKLKRERQARKSIKAPCSLNSMPSRARNRTIKLLEGGEGGFNQMIIETLLQIGVEVDMKPNMKTLKELLSCIQDAKKSIYGDKRRVEADIHDNTMTVDHFREAFKDVMNEEKEK